MSFIGFKVEANIPKNLDGLVTEGNLVHLTKAVLVNGNEAQICIDQPTGESTVVAILDKKMNRMVNLDLIFDQSGNSLLVKGDKTAEVHVSGYSEPSGDMPFEEFDSESCPEDFEMVENSENSDLVETEAKEVSGVDSASESSSDNKASAAAADNSSSSEDSSSDEEPEQKTKQVVPVAQDADSSEYSSDDEGSADENSVSSGSASDDVTEDQIKAMLKSLDVDAGVSDDSDSSSSADADQDGAVANQGSATSGSEESGSDDDSGDDQGDSSESDSDGLNAEEAEAPASKKRQREASDSESGSESGYGSESGSYDSSSTEEPPAKKAKKVLDPEEQFEQDLVKFLQANGRTPLTILGSSVKKDGGVKAKLSVFIKSRPNTFLVKGNQVELK